MSGAPVGFAAACAAIHASRFAAQGVDRFGLPLRVPTILEQRYEDQDARLAMCKPLVADLFRGVARMVGRAEARKLFDGAGKRAGPGAPAGSKALAKAKSDAALVLEFERIMPGMQARHGPLHALRRTAEHLCTCAGINSPSETEVDAILARRRRALKAREERDREAERARADLPSRTLLSVITDK